MARDDTFLFPFSMSAKSTHNSLVISPTSTPNLLGSVILGFSGVMISGSCRPSQSPVYPELSQESHSLKAAIYTLSTTDTNFRENEEIMKATV